MGYIRPGKYKGFEVVDLEGGSVRIVVGKDETVLGPDGFETTIEKLKPQTEPAEEPEPREKSWTEGMRKR